MPLTVRPLHLSSCQVWREPRANFHFHISVQCKNKGWITQRRVYLNILHPFSCLLPLNRFNMKLLLLTAAVLLLVVGEGAAERVLSRRTKRELASPLHVGGIRDPFGSYCQRRGGCCPGRDDLCTVPYLDTICYCDLFCNRTVSDCCPDFWGHCLGVQPPFIGK